MSVLRTSAVSRRTVIAGTWCALLTAVLLLPLRHSGYGLGHDMVFVPDQALNASSVGLSSSAPRAVPLDALVAIAGKLIGGQVVGRLALLLPLLAVGLGVAGLLRSYRAVSMMAGAGFSLWNPFVVERLALGQWALLWCYAALPWLLLVLRGTPSRRNTAALILVVAAGSITPTGGVILGVAAVVLAFSSRRRGWQAGQVVVIALVLQLPWVIAGLTSTADLSGDRSAVAAFASRAEQLGGVVPTLLTGGGIWNADVVPGTRSGALATVALVLLVAAAVLGWRGLLDLLGNRLAGCLGGLAAVGFVVAVLSSAPGGDALVSGLIAHVPGAALLRDAQKWIVPLVLLESLLVGAAVELVLRRLAGSPWLAALAIAVVAAPVLLMPDASGTLRPTLTPVHYPRDWTAVRRIVGSGGTVAILPFSSYRLFPWAPGRSVLDPAPRLLAADTVVDDRLVVGGQVLRGDDRRAASVRRAFAEPHPAPALASLGVSWVLVERHTPGGLPRLTGVTQVFSGPDLRLYRVPGPVAAVHLTAARKVAVISADAVAGLLVLLALGVGGWAAVDRGRKLISSGLRSRPRE